MTQFIVLSDGPEVIGLWQTERETTAARFRLTLGLTYPHCEVDVVAAQDLTSLRQTRPDTQSLRPERIDASAPA